MTDCIRSLLINCSHLKELFILSCLFAMQRGLSPHPLGADADEEVSGDFLSALCCCCLSAESARESGESSADKSGLVSAEYELTEEGRGPREGPGKHERI